MNVCGGGELVKRVIISETFVNKDVESVRPYRGCVLWSNGLDWIRCASVKVEVSRECVWGR